MSATGPPDKAGEVGKTLMLRVAEALPKDVGRGLARIDPEDLKALGVEVGDIVRIEGKRRTVAKAMPAFVEARGKGTGRGAILKGQCKPICGVRRRRG